MPRESRWRSVAGVLALSGGALLATGSAASPSPAAQDGLVLRLVVDECTYKAAGLP